MLRSLWPALALAAVLLAANWPLVIGRECPPFDAFSTFGIYHHIVGAFGRAGRWMTWNPWSNGGSPDYADPQFGAYSPLIILTAFIANGSEAGFRVYWLLAWYFGGLGMIVLGRHLRAPRWGCFAVSTAFAFCGFYTGHAEHTVAIYAFSALPWIIWRADVAIRSGRPVDAAQAGALLGLSALGGYPGVVVANAGYVALWTLGRAFTAPYTFKITIATRLMRWIATNAIVAAIFAIVAAATYVPFFVDAAGFTGRSAPLPRTLAVTNGALVPWTLDTFASPAIAPLDFGREPDPSLRSVYLGTLVPALAILALTRRRPHAATRWWIAGLAAVSLMCALSTTFPLRGWLYDCCFPFRYFRQAALLRGCFLFSICVLALYGCRDIAAWLRRTARLPPWMLAITATVVGVALTVCGIVFTAHPELTTLALAHAPVMWLMPIGALLVASSLPRRARRLLLIGSITTFATVDAVWSAAISGPLLHATNDKWYRASELRYQELDLTRRGLGREIESLDNVNLWHKVPVLRSYTPFQNAWFERLARQPVFERAATQPDRIFFAKDVPIVGADERIFEAMLDRARTVNAPVLLAQSPDALLSPRQAPQAPAATAAGDLARIATLTPASPIAAHVDRYLPDELTFSVTTPTSGWLLVTDRWARGWQASVNGVPTQVYAGDFVFRAVQVPAGRVQVRFTYEKSHGLWLVALSWSVCALLLIARPHTRLRASDRRGRNSTAAGPG